MAPYKNSYKASIDAMDNAIAHFPDSINSKENTIFIEPDMPEIKKRPVNLSLAKIRGTKRLIRETLSDILNIEDEDGDSNIEIILDKLVEKAKSGDIKSVELITKIMNEIDDAPKVDVTLPTINIVIDSDKDGVRFTEDPDKE